MISFFYKLSIHLSINPNISKLHPTIYQSMCPPLLHPACHLLTPQFLQNLASSLQDYMSFTLKLFHLIRNILDNDRSRLASAPLSLSLSNTRILFLSLPFLHSFSFSFVPLKIYILVLNDISFINRLWNN